MMNSNKTFTIVICIIGLFAVYLTLKWTCRLLFGLLDYALLIGLIVAVVWYVRLPLERKKELQERIKANIKAIGQRLDIS